MEGLYNYGISQEDVLTEYKALDLQPGDSLLCIASAGEIPLNIAALCNLNIIAVDTSIYQLRLCRIKREASIHLESINAAFFLGYMQMKETEREYLQRSY